jgi:hypothetical protein
VSPDLTHHRFLTTMTLSARGKASPDVVWERYADLDAWSQWSPQIRGVSAPDRRLRPGLEGQVRGPLGVRVAFTITDVQARSWSWQVRLPLGVRLELGHDVTAHGDGAATGLRVTGPAPLVLGYAPIAQLALHRLVSP